MLFLDNLLIQNPPIPSSYPVDVYLDMYAVSLVVKKFIQLAPW